MAPTPITPDAVIEELLQLANPDFKDGMQRFGIDSSTALGIRLPALRALARQIKKNHPLALQLWDTNVHEARLLAIFIAEPKQVTEELLECWVNDFSSWDICDQACSGLFIKTPFAYAKALEWTGSTDEFRKRAGFVMMATLAVHDKKAPDTSFLQFFPYLVQGATDNRNFVKKAVNWALRQIGKRNLFLNGQAIDLADQLKQSGSKSASWIASGALRELVSPQVQERLHKKEARRSR
ncbi:DNA alkylation repair protein [Botryobacter ruber]|uniref:DNA alkylation repair protein n=1 Tax=Botryobacter ruber TaxID=2171629 RepID=UPI000E0BEDE7|nr:DNA alkylation repair protein [Botryobacter ruber]